MCNVANSLTFLRLLMIPVLVYVYYTPYQWITPFLFLGACITDWLDGYLARSMKQVTDLGSFLDPVADKLLVVSIIVLLVSSHPIDITIPGTLIILREITMSSLREWMAKSSKNIPVSKLGKIKTTFQMIALTLLLSHHNSCVNQIGYYCLWIAVLLAWGSMFNYVKSIRR